MTGEAYRFSAEISRRMGPYDGFVLNKESQLAVIGMHRDAVSRVRAGLAGDRAIHDAAARAWDEALTLGKKHGVRNSQVTLLAPTGTISLMMDCATTGIEPEFALVKTKKLVGGGTMKFINTTVPQALEKLGYGADERAGILSHIEERGTIEGAPHLKESHLAVFDCAVKPLQGNRVISWQGHVKMVAAAQPFLSGAVSKTFNMSAETTAEEIMEAYIMGWKMGLKAFAVYRDGSKAAQPLNLSDKEKKKKEVASPVRRHLPPTRPSETHKFSIAGHEGFLTYSMHEDGTLGEIFIRMSKQGSTLAGLLDVAAISVSIAIQYGVPLKNFVKRFSYSRFEPAGYTENADIQVATSIADYIFRYLALRFLSEQELDELGIKAPPKEVAIAAEKPMTPEQKYEVRPVASVQTPVILTASEQSPKRVYADTMCRACGGMLIQTGTCKTCIQCGTSNGGC